MLRVMLQKLWHKKWMVLCLLVGSVLLIATAVSFPMYRSAAFDRMLRDEFEHSLSENGKWPGKLNFIFTAKAADGTKQTILDAESLIAQLYEQLSVTEYDTITYYATAKMKSFSLMQREDLGDVFLKLSMLSDLPEHIEIVAGEMYSEDGFSEDGSIEVIISQDCMVESKLLLGETFEFEKLKYSNEEPMRIKIVGVYREVTGNDFYWQVAKRERADACFVEETLYRQLFIEENEDRYNINCSYYAMFQYNDLKAAEVSELYEGTEYYLEDAFYKKVVDDADYMELIDSFEGKKARIEASLFILQVPVLVLLCAFLFMISGQMYDMERNEISVLKSRGSSGGQIFRLYLYQSVFLTLVGAVLGLPLGNVFCRILGSAQNFLEFDIRRKLEITYGSDVLLYAIVAITGSVLIMTLPAIKHSRVSIVNLKQQKAVGKKSWWEKSFLDVICLAVGIYGYYNFSTNESVMMEKVMAGEALDPLLYLSSSVFIVGAGLLFVRMQPLLIKGIYALGKRFWGPASYASFMENIRNGRKQQFIMLFLILTISLGMYHATVARTILQNALDNAAYLDGADVIIKELWEMNPLYEYDEEGTESQYIEPDYFKYSQLKTVEGYTKVLYDAKGYASGKNGRVAATVMGIHTKEFGENTWMPDGLMEKHYYEYLNALAVEPNGILVSGNFETVQEYKIGDTIQYFDVYGKKYSGKIVDFFDYWPGYDPTTTKLNTDGSVSITENYMVVGHYGTMLPTWGGTPYEVWISAKEDAGSQEIYQWIQDNDVSLRKYVNRQDNREAVLEDPLLQGTNGVLTMGFIVTMILCAVGYLIYWIMSIRSREMLFGVLRACGMHKGELFHMLINEQIFSGVFSVLAGLTIGKIASEMFVPILQTAYAASNQVLPMQLITDTADMTRLYIVIIGTMALCLLVLIVIVFKLNVVKALKLGEE